MATAFAALPTNTIEVGKHTTYHYVHIEASASKPYVLFLHGFPSSPYDWRHQISFFSEKGYGIIVPECLGYGKSSKPLAVEAYKLKKMASEIIAILDHESVQKVIGVGHDWGSQILSRLANYYPDRFLKYAFIDIGYQPPGMSLNLEVINHIDSMCKEKSGFECFGYFLLFQEQDASKLTNSNPDSTLSLFYSNDNELGKQYIGARGGFRKWLTEGQIAPPVSFVSEADMAYHRSYFFPDSGGGFAAPIMYYRTGPCNVNVKDEEEIPEENKVLKQPTLLITSENFISKAAKMDETMRPFAERAGFTVKHLDAGHWIQLQRKDEVNTILSEFFEK